MPKISSKRITSLVLSVALSFVFFQSLHAQQSAKTLRPTERNMVIFFADGSRHGSVNPTEAPTLLKLRQLGVHFVNSHSIFPTFTTANASVMATGHYLGDTGDFSNTIYAGYAFENDQILADLDDHYFGNYLNEETILSLAREHGHNTASVGKVGPVAIFDVSQLQPSNQQFPIPTTVFIDDATGSAAGIPLSSVTAAFAITTLPASCRNSRIHGITTMMKTMAAATTPANKLE